VAEFDPGRVNVYTGTHAIVDFQMDRKGIARCAMGPELGAAVLDVCERVAKPYAISISPASSEAHEHYVQAFDVALGTATIRSLRRVAGLLLNFSDHAAAVEWGNSSSGGKGHHVLGRTLSHLSGLGHKAN
jgi:hypothetical protein